MKGIHIVMFDFRFFDIYNEAGRKIGRIRFVARALPFKKEVILLTWHFGRPSWEEEEVIGAIVFF